MTTYSVSHADLDGRIVQEGDRVQRGDRLATVLIVEGPIPGSRATREGWGTLYVKPDYLLAQGLEVWEARTCRVVEATADDVDECEGHPAGPSDPMGETVYCDGSCNA